MHKCEAHAQPTKLSFRDSFGTINEWPHSWPDGEVTYRLNNYTKDISKKQWQDRAVTVALLTWQLRIKNLKFKRVRNPATPVDMNISFAPVTKFSSDGVLAHAWYPGQGEISGDVEINDEWDWVANSAQADRTHPPLVPILIHEFGHSLGLRHDDFEFDSIMYPSFRLGEKKNQLHIRDVIRIQDRYGKRSLPQRIIDYFRNRRDRGFDFR